MTFQKQNKLQAIIGTALLAIALAYGGTVFASHSFEAGVKGDSLPDNTHVRLNDLTLSPLEVLPVYDSSPNYIAGHFLYRGPCNDDHTPKVSVMAGHIDEHNDNTHMDLIPLFYIGAASTAGSCVWHSHIPDPLNGGSPRVTDIDLINLGSEDVTFSDSDVVDINVQQVLGSIGSSYEGDVQLPGEWDATNNPVFDLNDDDPNNDGLGLVEEGEGE
jgi:hypothetical protein